MHGLLVHTRGLLRLHAAIHHVLLARRLLGVLMRVLLVRDMLGLSLHMVVLSFVVAHVVVLHRALRAVQRRASGRAEDAALAHCSGLELTGCVHHRSLVAVGLAVVGHVHGAGAVGPVAAVAGVHLLLLGAVVRGVSDVHAVVGWKPRVGHTLGRLARCWRASVVVWRDALPQAHHVRVSPAGVGIGLDGASAGLRHLHSGAIVLVLMGMLR